MDMTPSVFSLGLGMNTLPTSHWKAQPSRHLPARGRRRHPPIFQEGEAKFGGKFQGQPWWIHQEVWTTETNSLKGDISGVVVHGCNPSTWVSEEEGLQVQDLHRKTLLQIAKWLVI